VNNGISGVPFTIMGEGIFPIVHSPSEARPGHEHFGRKKGPKSRKRGPIVLRSPQITLCLAEIGMNRAPKRDQISPNGGAIIFRMGRGTREWREGEFWGRPDPMVTLSDLGVMTGTGSETIMDTQE
jgi:hypothetical protein